MAKPPAKKLNVGRLLLTLIVLGGAGVAIWYLLTH